MVRHRGPVLVDTNVIIECWRVSAWKALTGGYTVETVEKCVIETQTGLQRRREEQQIDAAALRAVARSSTPYGCRSAPQRSLRDEQFNFLDPGEQLLWAHALTRPMPGCCAGRTRRACASASGLGFATGSSRWSACCSMWDFDRRNGLREAYTQRWLEKTLAELALLERQRHDHAPSTSVPASVDLMRRDLFGPHPQVDAGPANARCCRTKALALVCRRLHRVRPMTAVRPQDTTRTRKPRR